MNENEKSARQSFWYALDRRIRYPLGFRPVVIPRPGTGGPATDEETAEMQVEQEQANKEGSE